MNLQRLPYWLLLLVALACRTYLTGQPLKRLNSISYTVKEGLLYSKVIDLVDDGNGFIWISTDNGIQRFDGKTFFRILPATNKNALPDDKNARFLKLRNGNLWIYHSKGISEYDIHTDQFRDILKTETPRKDLVKFLLDENDEAAWCQFARGIYKLNKRTNRFTDSITLPHAITYQASAFSLKGAPVFFGSNGTQLFICGKSQASMRIYSVSPLQKQFVGWVRYNDDTLVVATKRGIEKMDIATGNFSFVCPYRTRSESMITSLYIKLYSPGNGTCLVSEGLELFELDLQQWKYTAKLVDMQNRNLLEVGFVSDFFLDSIHNLWLISENTGIRKLDYRTPGFKYFGLADRTKNFVKTIYADKGENRVLLGSLDKGLLVFDTSQQFLRSIDQFKGLNTAPTICGIHKTGPHHYLLFLMGTKKVFLLNTETFLVKDIHLDTTSIRLSNVFDYHMTIFPVSDTESILQNSYNVYRVKWRPPLTVFLEESNELPMASISSYIDPSNRLWVGGRWKYILFQNGISAFKEFDLQERILVRCFQNNKNGGTWMGTENGLHELDENGKLIRKIYKSSDRVDENIYAMGEDTKNNLWFSHNRGISCMKKDGSFIHFSENDGLQENEFNTNTFFSAPDGELFFGGVNGITSFYPEMVLRYYEQPRLLLTSIKVKEAKWESDSAAWNVRHIELPYSRNSLSFEFTAMGRRQPDQYNYQFRMKGVDESWINSSNTGMARYVLPPGQYVFELYADNSFEANAAPMKRVFILIRPPFWKTNWFIIGVVLLLASILILLTRYLARLKLKGKIKDLESKRALDQERLRIAREMHDDIGAWLTQITMMSEAAKRIMDVQRLDEIAIASRKLTSNMSEIIWSMNPQQNTLDELLAYLREQLRHLLEYSGIAFEINFEEPSKPISLNNAQRRNLLLVTKEIVHNAIKHSKAKNILIHFHQNGSSLEFSIKDDGIGFNPDQSFSGHGVRNIKRRIAELNGSLTMTSSSSGSLFRYTIPV